jgi:choline dehydrogenase
LSSGAVGSPHILMLSGIGPAAHLQEQGVDCQHNLSGVGGNLMDHVEVHVQFECEKPVSLYSDLRLLRKIRIGLEWFMLKKGIYTSNQWETGALIRSSSEATYPDIEIEFLPIAMTFGGVPAIDGHSFQLNVGPVRSKSRGTVRLASNDPAKPPSIHHNCMSHDDDWVEMRRAIRIARDVAGQTVFDDYRGREITPGVDCESDSELDEFIRDTVGSVYHLSGTCKMGTDEHSVVDPECRVIGIDNLRVVDASVFPEITYANINAPTIMVAEKASDYIRGCPLLRFGDK